MDDAPTPKATPFALFPLRVGLAAIFLYAGFTKMQDLASVAAMFAGWGIPLPGVTAPLVATVELLGGLGILLGFLARLSAGALSVVMATALLTVKLAGPFWNGWMVDLILLAGCLTVVVNGPGRPTLASVVEDDRLDLEARVAARFGGGDAGS